MGISIETIKEVIKITDPSFPVRASIQDSREIDLSSKPHIHNELELIYVPVGEMSFWINGETIQVGEGEIMLINGSVVHASVVQEMSNPTQLCLLQFDPGFIFGSTFLFEFKYLVPFMNQSSDNYHILNTVKSKDFLLISKLMLESVEEMSRMEVAYELSIKACLYKILTLLYRNDILSSGQSSNTKRSLNLLKLLEKVFILVENHYNEKITVDMVCGILSFNYYYFCRIFKMATGKTFIQYLNFVRISVAEKLLLTTDKTITEIMSETGFSSMSYFDRVFKGIKGCSPMTYRMNIGGMSQG